MLQTLNTIKNQIKELAEGQKKTRQVLTQDHGNYAENYKKVFGADAKMPPMWALQSSQVSGSRTLFELYTAYYIVKHRLQDDYEEYKEFVTSNSYLSNGGYSASDFWQKVDEYVVRWSVAILDELETCKQGKGNTADNTAVA